MTITNNSGLPQALVQAIKNIRAEYSKGDSDFSCTELLLPPRIRALKQQHAHEITEDAEDLLWSFYGSIVHKILEESNTVDIVEKRYFADFDGTIVSAQLDSLSIKHGVLRDYKFTTAWKFKVDQTEAPIDWVAQLNIQLEILRRNGLKASSLQIIGLLRDFSKLEARRNNNYPQKSVMIMSIPEWPREKTVEFIKERIALHRKAEIRLPECSQEDRWANPDKWAVMQKGKKRALKLCDTKEYAELLASQKSGYVEHRPGEVKRCSVYCPVNQFCNQYQNEINKRKENIA